MTYITNVEFKFIEYKFTFPINIFYFSNLFLSKNMFDEIKKLSRADKKFLKDDHARIAR